MKKGRPDGRPFLLLTQNILGSPNPTGFGDDRLHQGVV
jgi:hypothetical protein